MNIKLIDLIKEVKREAQKRNTFSYEKGSSTCLNRWLEETNSSYLDLFNFINIKQKDNKLLFKYKDFEKLFYENKNINYKDFWNLYDGVYRECRGLVYDIENDKIVALPFSKFFNIDEQPETSIANIKKMILSAKKIEFSNKLDGTLIISRWYENNLFYCTSGGLDYSEYVMKYAKKYLETESYKKLLCDYKDWTIMFEGVSPNNQLVVVYSQKDYGLHLIGMRNVETGELKSYSEILEIAKKYQISVTENYHMTFNEIMESRDKFKHTEKEGYVMYLDGMLIKIKCNDYILLHKMMRKYISKNDIIKAIAKNTIDDMISANDENIQNVIYETINIINNYCSKMEDKVQEIFNKMPKDRVEFFKYANTVPKIYRKYLIAKYYNKPYSFLVELESGDSTSYIKYAEIERRLEIL